jgi:hypothetical protein
VIKFNPDEDKQNLFIAGMSNKKIIQWDTRSGEIEQVLVFGLEMYFKIDFRNMIAILAQSIPSHFSIKIVVSSQLRMINHFAFGNCMFKSIYRNNSSKF